MAATLSDLQGWQVIKKDSEGKILPDDSSTRRSRRRAQKENGEREHIFLQRVSDKVELGCGSTVIIEDKSINSFSLHMIHEIRLNTLNHIVELWAFSYLRWFEVKPKEYYVHFEPKLLEEDHPKEFFVEKFNNECNKSEAFLTAELSEIQLKDFLGKAKVLDYREFQSFSADNKLEDDTFLVRVACEPDGSTFASIDIHSYERKVIALDPKVSETYLKGLTGAILQMHARNARRSALKTREEPKLIKPEVVSQTLHAASESNTSQTVKQTIEETTKQTAEMPVLPVVKSKPVYDLSAQPPQPSNINAVESSSEVVVPSYLKSAGIPKDNGAGAIHTVADEVSSPSEVANEDSRFSSQDESESENSGTEDEEFQDAVDDIDYMGIHAGLAPTVDQNGLGDEEDDSDESNIDIEEDDDELYIGPGKRSTGRSKGRPKKVRKLLDSSVPATPRKQQTPSINSSGAPATLFKKYTKKNVSRAKKAYTPFSKRFKRPQDIPDLRKLAEFNQDRIDMDIAAIENKLRSPKKQQTVETIFSRVKQELYTTHGKDEIVKAANFDDYLPARENEFASIYLSLYSAIEAGSGTTLYIAGTPGVGKTLTVREVVKELLCSADQNELPSFQYVEINGLKMIKPSDSYEVLWNKISGERLTSGAAMESLEFYFNKVPKMKKRPILVLLDELDALVTKSQDVMYNFFNWTTYPNAKLIVVAVANTMDLPERQLGNKVSSRIGFTRIMFTGYNHDELKTIINLRLKGLNESYFFVDVKNGSAHMVMNEDDEQTLDTSGMKKVKLKISKDAIEIASRKIASVSGDARRALKACKRAVEIAEHDYMDKNGYRYDGESTNNIITTNEGNGEETQTVEISHIMRALNETVNSPITVFLMNLSFTGKLFLHALLNLIRKTGAQEQTLGDIVDEIKSSIDANGKNKFIVAMHEVLFTGGSKVTSDQLRIISWDHLVNKLIEAGIIIKQNLKNERATAVKFSVPLEDVKKAIEQDKVLKTL